MGKVTVWLLISLLLGSLIVGCSLFQSSNQPTDTSTAAESSGEPANDGAAQTTDAPGAAGLSETALDAIVERGVLRVGVDCQYRGTCYLDPETNERTGYSVVLTELMAEDLGVDIEWIDLEWTALIPSVQTGQVDIITMGMTNTPQRAMAAGMSNPMDYYPGVLILPADSPLHQLESLDEVITELNQPDRTIAFLLGGAQERTTKRMLPNAQHRGLDLSAAYLEVASGRSDAMFADAGDAFDLTQEDPGAKIWQDQIVYTEHGSFVIRRDDQPFMNWLNNWIDYYESNGTLRSIKLSSFEERGVPTWMRAYPPSN